MRSSNFFAPAISLTAANFLGFLAIRPFTPYTFFIGLPAGIAAVVYLGQQILASANTLGGRILAESFMITNVFILYLTLNLL